MDPHTRILYVITKANWGGAQRYVYDMATAAKTEGHEVAVAYGEPGVLTKRLEEAGVKCVLIPSLARDLNLTEEFAAFRELLKLFRSSAPHVVHVNSSKGGLAILAARLTGVRRIIFTAHGWAFNEARPIWQKALIYIAHALTIYLSHTTICVSDAVRRDMRLLPFGAMKLTVIRNGITAPAQKTRSEARRALLPQVRASTWIGTIAELHPTKRLDDLIKAFADLRDIQPDAILVIVGEGQERQYLEDLIRAYTLEHRVFLTGFREDAPSCLLAFDLFVLPSLSEALAFVLLEAGSASLPVIATRVGGIPEVILHKKTGLLVPPQQPAVLSRTIANVLADKALAKELGTNLAAHIRGSFSKERMTRDTLALY